MIKSFRGLLADDTQQRITLHTNDGKTGYRIVKFQCMQVTFENAEQIIQIWKVSQSTNSATIDFSDNRLLGAAMISGESSGHTRPEDVLIVFDNVIFNQDIYITSKGTSGFNVGTNYLIELEQMPLDVNESTVATLQSIRSA